MIAAARVTPRWALPALVWLTTFGVSIVRVHFVNDHFDRISRARQILAYGEHPFADFRDPGYFLMLYVSAAGQAVTGGGILGEAVIASAAFATAAALTFWLARSASGSPLIALLAVGFTWVVPARYYDYDKVLFYTGGLALCWRYVDAPTPRRIVAAGVATGVAALFRYDTGLYLVAACLTAVAMRHAPDWRRAARDAALYLVAVAVALAPALLFTQVTAGLGEALRQIATYAETEGTRSELFRLPRLGADPASVVYVFAVAIAPVALVLVPHAKVMSAAVLGACISIFVLRDPIAARIGAAVPVAVVLAAASIAGVRSPSHRVRQAAILVLCAAAVAMVAWQRARVLQFPSALSRRLSAVASLGVSPPSAAYFPENGALAGMAAYLRACTTPDSRVVLTWFAPEVFFFSQRGFAGGMIVYLGDHWSSDLDQQRTIEQMTTQRVPLVIIEENSVGAFQSRFARVAAYVDSQYRFAASSSFADPRVGSHGYRVLIKRDLGAVANEPRWMLPCPH